MDFLIHDRFSVVFIYFKFQYGLNVIFNVKPHNKIGQELCTFYNNSEQYCFGLNSKSCRDIMNKV